MLSVSNDGHIVTVKLDGTPILVLTLSAWSEMLTGAVVPVEDKRFG